jgi:hypothetical protein
MKRYMYILGYITTLYWQSILGARPIIPTPFALRVRVKAWDGRRDVLRGPRRVLADITVRLSAVCDTLEQGVTDRAS